MTLTLEINPDLEAALRATADGAGLPIDRYVLDVLHRLVAPPRIGQQGLPPAEAALLEKINEGLPLITWERYRELKERRHAEGFTAEEQEELLRLVNEVELWNPWRLQWVAELSRLRDVPFPDLVRQLGLGAPPG